MTKIGTCVIVGASHAGVNAAFALRKEGWEGEITLVDIDPMLPYHRPPLSKALLANEEPVEKYCLKSADSYTGENISLKLGYKVEAIDRKQQSVSLVGGELLPYKKLILATGARALVPPIEGIETSTNLYFLRTASDALHIRERLQHSPQKRVVVIGGGYIGLEVAASLRKLDVEVTVLEREDRLMARVTAPELSDYFQGLHEENGGKICTGKTVTKIEPLGNGSKVICADGSSFLADIVVVGVGILVNTELAEQAGLEIEDGIKVDATARTSDAHIYAIGDCSFHYNPHYNQYIRLESVQNAVDQAKVAAAAICGKDVTYDAIPWFWSDQYDVKLQMVGLSQGYDEALVRRESNNHKAFSIWYFKEGNLLAVDAVNNARAYMMGTKIIERNKRIDKSKLIDPEVELRPANFLSA